MSIMIDKAKCKGCGMCTSVCPGSLIYQDSEKKAFIKYPKDCWGCASCIKECHFGAIALYLGADIGGMGSDDWMKYVNSRYENGQLHMIYRELVGREARYEHND